jgi:hypothetical protein
LGTPGKERDTKRLRKNEKVVITLCGDTGIWKIVCLPLGWATWPKKLDPRKTSMAGIGNLSATGCTEIRNFGWDSKLVRSAAFPDRMGF